MSEISVEQVVDITRFVSVEFDRDNRPEYVRKGKTYQVASVIIPYKFRNDRWESPWSIRGMRAVLLKSGEWGSLVSADLYDARALIPELCDEYRPATRIEIKESN